jgi:hypothetical protein
MRHLTLLLASTLFACSEPAGPGNSAQPVFEVRDTLFRLDSLGTLVHVAIPYRLVNASVRTLYVDRCLDGADLERQVANGGWATAWDRVRACAQSAPRPLGPNDSVVGVFDVNGSLQAGSLQRFDIPADTLWHFRLRLPLYNANGTAIPESPQTRSTTFTIIP